MSEAYFVERLKEALLLTQKAKTENERSIHLRNVQLYRGLIDFCSKHGPVRRRPK